jgi:cystathionine beta-lyase/cystathionine gamma-synthase
MADLPSNARFATLAVHAGQQPDPSTGAIMTPIYQTSTYVQAGPGDHQGHEYARVTNPTRSALEGNLAALEGARHGVVFSSGVAAMDAILRRLRPGDHVVSTNDLYGGTYRLMRTQFEHLGIDFSFVDMTDLYAVRATLRPSTVMLWAETPTNPLLKVADIAGLAEVARGGEGKIDLVVDNTFATPVLQQPLALGADLVVHSATKYLGGHSDVILGAVCTSDDDWTEHLRFQVKCVGAVPGPLDCFLVLRGTKTLHLRVERSTQNAGAVARMLAEHPAVGHVFYPGLESHPGYETAQRQTRGAGGMVSFTLKDDTEAAATRVLQSTRVFQLAESLGGVESLIEHPATMTHGSIPAEERRAAGFLDSLIRLSVGVEDEADLLEDLRQALG